MKLKVITKTNTNYEIEIALFEGNRLINGWNHKFTNLVEAINFIDKLKQFANSKLLESGNI